MSVYSIVNYSDFHDGLDFDAEHYHPVRLDAFKHLYSASDKMVGDLFTLVSDVGVPAGDAEVYDLTDALGCFLSGDGNRSSESLKKRTKSGDIIVSRLRSYLREICVIPKRSETYAPYISTEFVVLRPNRAHSLWLLPFLLSKSVQSILTWSQTGNLHPRIHASDLLSIPVPAGVEQINVVVSKMVCDAIRLYESSLTLYPQAEQELLARIGTKGIPASTNDLSHIERYSALVERNRFDAEHFHPKYKQLTKYLRKAGAMNISDLVETFDKGTQPDAYVKDGDIFVVKSKDVFGRGINLEACDKTAMRIWNDKAARLSNGNVVINSTGAGTLGRAGAYHFDGRKAVASVDLVIMRVKQDIIDPDYLSLFLNSPFGIAQSEQYQTGSSGQLHLYLEHIRQFIVYIPQTKDRQPDLAWQKKIGDMVRKSIAKKGEAKKLLDKAVLAVEKAIGCC